MKIKDRLYSVVTVKKLDDEKREFSGIASTPTPDRVGDIVEPKGAKFNLPIPLLWQHDHNSPVGTITEVKVTDEGIEVKGTVAQVDSPNGLKARLDEAWASLKAGLVRGLSIGFTPLEYSWMESGGIHFLEWDWHELSLVTIPANAEGNISNIKSFDDTTRAALGLKGLVEVKEPTPKASTPGDAGTVTTVKLKPKDAQGGENMNISEQLKRFREEREQKAAAMVAIMEKAEGEGITLDAEQSEEYDALEAEVLAIDKHIERLEKTEKLLVAKAKPVPAAPTVTPAQPYQAKGAPEVQLKTKLTDGLAIAQVCKFMARAKGNMPQAMAMAEQAPNLDSRVVPFMKAAVSAGTTDSSNWAGDLVGSESSVYADFVEYLRPRTILGRFGMDGIPSLRNIPFSTALISQTGAGAGYWVGESAPKPATSFDFDRTTLGPLKVANIAVLTDEVIRDSSPAADAIIRDELVKALAGRLDTDFIDPDKAASAGVSPAGILNGVTAVSSSGTDAAAVRTDFQALMAAYISNNQTPASAVIIMDSTRALALSLMQNPLGQSEFPGITMAGGTLFGLPVIVSEYCPTDSNGGIVAMVNAQDIYLGDEGGFSVDMSTEAAIQMNTTPDNPATASTVLTSMWQHNMVAFRAERTINWSKRRTQAAQYVYGVNWA